MIFLFVWSWLMVGCLIGRIAFVRVLGDHDRYGRNNYGGTGSTDAYYRARWVAVACVPFWPLAGPMAMMFSQTWSEKVKGRKEKLEKELAKLRAEVREAEEELQATYRKEGT